MANQFDHADISASDLLPITVFPTNLFWKEITDAEILNTVSKMSNFKSVDHYGLSNNILKKTIHLASVPLAVKLKTCVKAG